MNTTRQDDQPAVEALWGTYAVPTLEGVHGTIELVGPLHRVFMKIDGGEVTIGPSDGRADTVVRSEVPDVLPRVVRGELNIVTAALRGLVEAEGNLVLALQIAGSIRDLGRRLATSAAPARGDE